MAVHRRYKLLVDTDEDLLAGLQRLRGILQAEIAEAKSSLDIANTTVATVDDALNFLNPVWAAAHAAQEEREHE